MVRGYHVYKDVWDTVAGEEMLCKAEPQNSSDRFAVAILKENMFVGHIPFLFLAVCSIFLKH